MVVETLVRGEVANKQFVVLSSVLLVRDIGQGQSDIEPSSTICTVEI